MIENDIQLSHKDSYAIEEIKVGMVASYSQTITDADIKVFAGLSGDNNPMHMNDVYAEKSRFKKRIAHGLLSSSFFSALFGTRLPGQGCVYASQNLIFKRPVYIGDTITATIKVTSIDYRRKIVVFDTFCTVKAKKVIDGTAEIFIP